MELAALRPAYRDDLRRFDDLTRVLVGTGRRAPTVVEQQAPGAGADRLPLLA